MLTIFCIHNITLNQIIIICLLSYMLMFMSAFISLVLDLTMAASVELFKFLQNYYKTIGIYPPASQSSQNCRLNSKNVFCIFCMANFATFAGIFFLFKAKQLDEFCISFFCSGSTTIGVFYLISLLYQIENILKLIETFEGLIEKSEQFSSNRNMLSMLT